MIELRDVDVRRGSFQLERLALSLAAGDYAVLMGRSGSGKTTILEVLAGLVRPARGRVLLRGQDLTDAPPAARGVGYVPQDGALFRSRSVAGNLGFALELRGASRLERSRSVAAMAERLGIGSLLERRIAELSGGERQRVALGRALLAGTQVLLLDEPLSALDEALWESTGALLRQLHAEEGLTVLHVTHRASEAQWLGQRRFSIEGGVLREGGGARHAHGVKVEEAER